MLSRRTARITLAVLLGAIYSTLGVARVITEALRERGWLTRAVALAFAVAAVVVVVGLLRDPRHRSVRLLAGLAVVGGLYAAALLPMQSPEEKLHFIEYGLVGVLAWASAPARVGGWRRVAFAAGLTLAAGWGDEGIQAILPNRYYDLRDVAFNLTAGLLALTALEVVRWLRRPATT